MAIEGFLLTLAQIAVTFAGLVGIMVAFTAGNGKLTLSDSLRVRVIVILSIYIALFSLLPLALLSISALAPYAYSASVVLFLIFLVIFFISQRRHELRAGKVVMQDMQGAHRDIAWLIMSLVITLNIVNLSPLLGPVQPGLYGMALLLSMFATGGVYIGLIAQRLL